MARSYKNRIAVVLGVLAVAALLIWGLQPSPVTVTTARVERGSLSTTVTADGRTRIRNVYSIVAPVDGDVDRIDLKVGDPVAQGAVIARIGPVAPRPLDDRSRAEAVAAVSAAQSAVTQAEANEKEAAAALVHAQSELDTTRKLVREGITPKNSLEHGEHQVEIRRQAVEAARAGIQTSKAQLARAQALAGSTGNASVQPPIPIRSPIAGRVLRVIRESSGPVAVGSPLVEIGNTRAIEITTDLLTEDAMAIKPGAAALIQEWGGDALKAQVRSIEPAAFTKISALGLEEQRVKAILDLTDKPPATLGHDFHVSVSIVLWRDDNVLTVPSTALFRSGDQWVTFVVDNGSAHLRVVEPGRADSSKTAIVSGLAEGEEIVTQPSDLLQEGTRVKRFP
jgi:HlyD family secretion protein